MPPIPLELNAAHCRYGDRSAVRGATFALRPGEIAALTGGNGAGKTTLLRAVFGLHPLASGTIMVDGVAVERAALPSIRSRIAWLPQRLPVGRFPFRTSELLASSADPAAAWEQARALEVADLAETPLSKLSGGQLQRVYLARALGSIQAGAGLLLADEPSAAMDEDGRRLLTAALANLNATVLLATHSQDLAECCKRILRMDNGHVEEDA